MILADIPAGALVFIDANTFVYHFTPHPIFNIACGELLARVARGEVSAATSIDALSDVAHRIMTLEAAAKHSWPVAGIAQRLRKHSQVIQSLSLFRQAVDEVPRLGIEILVPQPSIVSAAAVTSQQYGLLSGDALIVAMMQQFGISSLASHDADFDRVSWITRYAPA